MKRNSVLVLGLAALLSVGLFAPGCGGGGGGGGTGSDGAVDGGGKKDTGAKLDVKGIDSVTSTGGARDGGGGVTGTGGTTGGGGAIDAAGGVTGTGGAKDAGGVTGTGGVTTGGTTGTDGGPVDGAHDAFVRLDSSVDQTKPDGSPDAPDAPTKFDTTGPETRDGGLDGPHSILDTQKLDSEVDAGADGPLVRLDAEIDSPPAVDTTLVDSEIDSDHLDSSVDLP